MTEKTHSENTSADKKAIGFDFQYYYFLYRLLSLKSGETVGLEVKDDVHTELSDDSQILVQLKHTVQNKSDGTTKNLTTLDVDLWKTLYNWCEIVSDENDGRNEQKDQLSFIQKTDFLLVSNKSENGKNVFLISLSKFKNNEILLNEIKKLVQELHDSCKTEHIKKYLLTVIEMEDEILESFLRRVDYELNVDDIIERIKQSIKEKMVPENKIDDVFKKLDSQIREDNFITIRDGEKISISFDDFYRKYRRHFDLSRNKDLQIRHFDSRLPDNIGSQTFIKQLVDIEDINSNDDETIAEFTRCKLFLSNNIGVWLREGELTNIEKEAFDSEAIARWKNRFRSIYRESQSNQTDVRKAARQIVDEIRKERLRISSLELGTEMSNGEYYQLSDIPQIGWLKEWEEIYK
ncbi:MAG: hypothetical protein QNJ97_27715 [Myxococcota bacterium]|nr:hypothetical protein [Myxococcota bacterium]